MNTRALLILLGLCLATTCLAQTAAEIGCDGCRPGRCRRTRGDRVVVCRSCEAGYTLTRLDDRISRVCLKDDSDEDDGDDDDVDVKLGTCPAVVPGSFGCDETCQSDSDCDGVAKCCETACGKICFIPEGVEPTEPAPVAEPSTIVATPVSVPEPEEPAVAPAPQAEVSIEEPVSAVPPAVETPTVVITPAPEAPSVAPTPEVDSTIDEPTMAMPPAMEVASDIEEVPSVDAPAPEASTDLDLGESPQMEVMEMQDVVPSPMVEEMIPSMPQIPEDSDSLADADLPDEDQESDVAKGPEAPVGEDDEEDVLRELDGMDS